MRIKIAARHCEIRDSVRERTIEQMERLTKYHPRVTGADVVFSEVKRSKAVEVILSVDGGEPVVAHAEGEEFRTALDKVADRLGRMLRRRRSVRTDHQAPSLADVVPPDVTE